VHTLLYGIDPFVELVQCVHGLPWQGFDVAPLSYLDVAMAQDGLNGLVGHPKVVQVRS
jgi:hypothetical protein